MIADELRRRRERNSLPDAPATCILGIEIKPNALPKDGVSISNAGERNNVSENGSDVD